VVAVAVPLDIVEQHLRETYSTLTGASVNGWLQQSQGRVLKLIERQRSRAVKESQFIEVISPERWAQFESGLPGETPTPLCILGQQKKVGKPSALIWRPLPRGKQKPRVGTQLLVVRETSSLAGEAPDVPEA
jgi:hypothetical protein